MPGKFLKLIYIGLKILIYQMIRKKLDNITEEDIEDLIVNEELESKTIEYKSELPANNYY